MDMHTDQNATQRPFRFFDNREKYLLFVTTCGEKWAVAERLWREVERRLPRDHPRGARPPRRTVVHRRIVCRDPDPGLTAAASMA